MGNGEDLTVSDLVQNVSTRAFIAGKTGSGKSSLAYVLVEEIYQRQPIIIIDPKGTWNIPEYGTLWTDISEPVEGSYLVYRPSFGNDAAEEIDTICKMVYDNAKKGYPCAVYIDELLPLLGRDTINGPRNLKFLYTQGRQLGVTMLLGTQRPSSIPQYVMTECEYLYCFQLRNQKDRERMGDYFGDEFRRYVPRYHFQYYCEEYDIHPKVLKLEPETIKLYCPGWE